RGLARGRIGDRPVRAAGATAATAGTDAARSPQPGRYPDPAAPLDATNFDSLEAARRRCQAEMAEFRQSLILNPATPLRKIRIANENDLHYQYSCRATPGIAQAGIRDRSSFTR